MRKKKYCKINQTGLHIEERLKGCWGQFWSLKLKYIYESICILSSYFPYLRINTHQYFKLNAQKQLQFHLTEKGIVFPKIMNDRYIQNKAVQSKVLRVVAWGNTCYLQHLKKKKRFNLYQTFVPRHFIPQYLPSVVYIPYLQLSIFPARENNRLYHKCKKLIKDE